MKCSLILLFFVLNYFSFSNEYIYKYTKNETLTYDEIKEAYSQLSDFYKIGNLIEIGDSDIGRPILGFFLNKENSNKIEDFKKSERVNLLINNAIHPGEPCGVDASLNFAKSIMELPFLLENMNILIITAHNVGGMLNRSCCSRANQNGPIEYGFRGNAKNLDLNRDLIKLDSKNSMTLVDVFNKFNPDVFVDAHSTNGADYPYDMTLISTQKNKISKPLSDYMHKEMIPFLYDKLEGYGLRMAPYFHTIDGIIENGLKEYYDSPRYSTGYSTLLNCIGLVTEAHMLKPYARRVEATIAFLVSLAKFIDDNSKKIKELRIEAFTIDKEKKFFPLNWELDTNRFREIELNLYRKKYRTSNITGLERYYYDTSDMYSKKIKYYDEYLELNLAEKPLLYIIPQSQKRVIDNLMLNGVQVFELGVDTTLVVSYNRIVTYETTKRPYEGHYLHYNIESQIEKDTIQFYVGDYLVYCNQDKVRFIIETLEPEAVDSYFAWNYFDEFLMQKEWFSDYLFEEYAEEMINENPKLKSEFVKYLNDNPEYKDDNYMQLYFFYKQSKYFEKSLNRLPIYKIYEDE